MRDMVAPLDVRHSHSCAKERYHATMFASYIGLAAVLEAAAATWMASCSAAGCAVGGEGVHKFTGALLPASAATHS